MTGPVLFISHSAKEPESRAALEALVPMLDCCEVRLDKRIRGGDAWRTRIAEYMDECESAIVLISTNALRSQHVQNEVAVLLQRAGSAESRREPFKLVPVLCGVTRDQVRNSSNLGPTNIREAQMLTWGEDVRDRILAALAPVIEDAAARELPEYTLLLRLVQEMRPLAPETILDVGGCVNVPVPALRDRGAKALARGLLSATHEDQVCAVTRLGAYSPDMRRCGLRARGALRARTLVPPDAAGMLRARAKAPPRERGAAIRCEEDDVCRLFVQRANFRWRTITVARDWSDRVVEDILDGICDELAAALGCEDDEVIEPSELNRLLVETPVFLVLPRRLPPTTVICCRPRAPG